jgi:hypothetical protein
LLKKRCLFFSATGEVLFKLFFKKKIAFKLKFLVFFPIG